MDKSKSFAEVTSAKKYKNIVNDWPDLTKQQKNKITRNEAGKSTGSTTDQTITLTNAMERLSTDDVVDNNEAAQVQKSKAEIRAERQLRRKSKKIEKAEQRFQEKLAQIREPKSQKLQVVDKMVLDTYLTSSKESPASDRRQIKSRNRTSVKIDLLDLINTKVVRPIDRSSIQSKQTTKFTCGTQLHKGKKREDMKKKYLTKLKRSILQSRQLRKEMKTKVEDLVSAEDLVEKIDLNDRQCTENVSLEATEATSNDKSTVMNLGASGVKFSRKFRSYCDNRTSAELLSLTEALLRDIFRFQDRAYNKNEVKARAQRRYVVGFKESMRQLDIGKLKLLIIAPDLEQSSENGGIDEIINEMKIKCQKSDVPYVFSLKRRQLGYVLFKKVPVSCVGVLNYQGSEETSRKLLLLIEEERLRFNQK